jgi:hypothetical protein
VGYSAAVRFATTTICNVLHELRSPTLPEHSVCMWVLHAADGVGLKKATYEQKIAACKWGAESFGGNRLDDRGVSH